MNLSMLKSAAQALGQKGLLMGAKYGPHVMVGAGVVGMIVSTVLACKATLKIEEVQDEADEKREKVYLGREKYDLEKYSEKAYARDLALVEVQKWLSLGKLYAPAVGVGLVSLSAILGSHGIMTQRNAALMAAYKALDLGFKKYRNRVVDEFGWDKDEKYLYGQKETTVEKALGLDQDGDPFVVTEKVLTPGEPSVYAVWFSAETSTQYRNDPIHNQFWITQAQNYMNDRLNSVGIVFLNEAYEALGMPKTSAGQVVGWVRHSKTGDGVIDFGLNLPRNREFMEGRYVDPLLDFNVDGVVYDQI